MEEIRGMPEEVITPYEIIFPKVRKRRRIWIVAGVVVLGAIVCAGLGVG